MSINVLPSFSEYLRKESVVALRRISYIVLVSSILQTHGSTARISIEQQFIEAFEKAERLYGRPKAHSMQNLNDTSSLASSQYIQFSAKQLLENTVNIAQGIIGYPNDDRERSLLRDPKLIKLIEEIKRKGPYDRMHVYFFNTEKTLLKIDLEKKGTTITQYYHFDGGKTRLLTASTLLEAQTEIKK